MEKTAIQQSIDLLNAQIAELEKQKNGMPAQRSKLHLQLKIELNKEVIASLESMLQVEKEQMHQAWEDGAMACKMELLEQVTFETFYFNYFNL